MRPPFEAIPHLAPVLEVLAELRATYPSPLDLSGSLVLLLVVVSGCFGTEPA